MAKFELKKTKRGLAGRIRKAIGAAEQEPVTVMTPQFTRPETYPSPACPPADRAAWDALRGMSKIALREMGLGAWGDEPEGSGNMLMLFPGEWYRHIPNGYMVTFIGGGKPEPFELGVTDDDIRFGNLAYGIFAARDKSKPASRRRG